MAGPLFGLYNISIIIVWIIERGRRKERWPSSPSRPAPISYRWNDNGRARPAPALGSSSFAGPSDRYRGAGDTAHQDPKDGGVDQPAASDLGDGGVEAVELVEDRLFPRLIGQLGLARADAPDLGAADAEAVVFVREQGPFFKIASRAWLTFCVVVLGNSLDELSME